MISLAHRRDLRSALCGARLLDTFTATAVCAGLRTGFGLFGLLVGAPGGHASRRRFVCTLLVRGLLGMGLWRRPVVRVLAGDGGRVAPAVRLRCAVVPPLARAWRGDAALQAVGVRAAHRLMSSAAQGTEDREEAGEDAQLDESAAAPEMELAFTAAQVEAAVQQAVGAGSFDGDLDAKFGVLSACAGLLGGHRIPNALLHTIQTPQQLTAYYVDALVSSDDHASLSVDDLPPNLILDDRDEGMVERVLRKGAQ